MHLARPVSIGPARHAPVVAALLVGLALGAAQAADPQLVKTVKLSEDTHGATPAKAAVAGAAASAATPMAASQDPLEVLRQRLAGKLTGAKSNEGANALELRLNSKPPVVADHGTTHKAVPARKVAAQPGAGAAHGAASGHAHWSYQGPAGPQTWGGLKPEFKIGRAHV